jgi:hypothetical protein
MVTSETIILKNFIFKEKITMIFIMGTNYFYICEFIDRLTFFNYIFIFLYL